MSPQTDYLDEQYLNLAKASSAYGRLNIINTIIEIKVDLNVQEYRRSIYQDIREFFKSYVDAIEEQKSNYYILNENTVLTKLRLLSIEDQLSILNFLKRLLKQHAFDTDYKWLQKLLQKKQIEKCKLKFNLSTAPKIAILYSTLNLKFLFVALLIIYLLYSILLLPARFKSLELFEVEYVKYHSNSIANHFLNTLLSFLQIDTDFTLTPINTGGVILLIFIKLMILTVIFKYLSKEIKERFE